MDQKEKARLTNELISQRKAASTPPFKAKPMEGTLIDLDLTLPAADGEVPLTVQQPPLFGYQGMNGYPSAGNGQSIPVNGYGQSIPINGYGQSIPVNGYGQSIPVNGYSQTVPVNGYGQSVPVNGFSTNQPMLNPNRPTLQSNLPSSTGFAQKNHPSPSSDEEKWWERGIDVSQVPFQGTATNPFYNFDARPLPSTRAPPPLPSRSSKQVNLMD